MRDIQYSFRILCLAFVISVTVAGCANEHRNANQTSETDINIPIDNNNSEAQPLGEIGMLIGKVTKGPISPVEGRKNLHSTEPVKGATIIISILDGQVIKSVITDDQGRYSINLLPGAYQIKMSPFEGIGFTKDLPATITITEGQETHLNVLVDTGIR